VRCSFSSVHGGPTDDSIRSPGCSKGRFADPPWPRDSTRWLEFDRLLPADHPARWIDRFVDSLDLTPLRGAYRGVGSQAHPPDSMLKMALWQIHDGRPSPAQWASAMSTDMAMLWLGQGVRPSRSAWYAFRARLGLVLGGLNDAVVRRAIDEGLIDPRCGVIDGTAVRTQASRHRLQNREHLERRRAALSRAIEEDGTEPSADGTEPPAGGTEPPAGGTEAPAGGTEPAAGGTEAPADGTEPPAEAPRPGWMAQTERGRRQQARRHETAAAVLGRRLAENARRPKDRRLDERHVVISVSDPEAVPGRDKEKVFAPLFTISALIDEGSLMVIAYEVLAQATDARTLPLLLDHARDVIGRHVEKAIGDSGFVSVADLKACAARGVTLYGPIQENDFSGTRGKAGKAGKKLLPKTSFAWDEATRTYVCPQGHRMPLQKRQRKSRAGGEVAELEVYGCPPEHCLGCPLRQGCTRNAEKGRTVTRQAGEELLEEHRRRMEGAEAKGLRRRRGAVIERVFGDAKEHRQMRRFHGRGLNNAKAETGLVILVFNAMARERLQAKRATPEESTT
jgi:transposase